MRACKGNFRFWSIGYTFFTIYLPKYIENVSESFYQNKAVINIKTIGTSRNTPKLQQVRQPPFESSVVEEAVEFAQGFVVREAERGHRGLKVRPTLPSASPETVPPTSSPSGS